MFQIFPEACQESDSSSIPEDFLFGRERLPSIVVELESGEVNWPPQGNMMTEDEEQNSNIDHTEVSLDRDQQDDMGTEEG